MAEGQQALYKALQEAEFAGLDHHEDGARAAFARHGQVLSMIHALREVWNHPANLKAQRRPEGAEAVRMGVPTIGRKWQRQVHRPAGFVARNLCSQ